MRSPTPDLVFFTFSPLPSFRCSPLPLDQISRPNERRNPSAFLINRLRSTTLALLNEKTCVFSYLETNSHADRTTDHRGTDQQAFIALVGRATQPRQPPFPDHCKPYSAIATKPYPDNCSATCHKGNAYLSPNEQENELSETHTYKGNQEPKSYVHGCLLRRWNGEPRLRAKFVVFLRCYRKHF